MYHAQCITLYSWYKCHLLVAWDITSRWIIDLVCISQFTQAALRTFLYYAYGFRTEIHSASPYSNIYASLCDSFVWILAFYIFNTCMWVTKLYFTFILMRFLSWGIYYCQRADILVNSLCCEIMSNRLVIDVFVKLNMFRLTNTRRHNIGWLFPPTLISILYMDVNDGSSIQIQF